MFDYLVAHGRMKEKEARAKFRQVGVTPSLGCGPNLCSGGWHAGSSCHLSAASEGRLGPAYQRGGLEAGRRVAAPPARAAASGLTPLPSFQIVSAVQYCHQKFIVHRDLKVRHALASRV